MLEACRLVRNLFATAKAYRAQRWIAEHALVEDRYGLVRVVAGLDVAYKRGRHGEDVGVGVAVALSYPSLKPLACEALARVICVPYVPGLLAFREMAVLAPALARLLRRVSVDLVLVDGHGIAHPRRAGIATHVGVVFDIPSIGVAKKRLYGREKAVGDKTLLVDDGGRPIAMIIERGRSRIYVSPGHRISVESSARLVKTMLKRGRLPEPTRVADSLTKSLKRVVGEISCCDPVSLRTPQCGSNSRNIFSS
ncbi:MAG: endonuclease V [Desulfurococcales archaeon]|nr:endonuclease V [Desulfurococcales archaeon]